MVTLNMNILLVEDDPADVDLTKESLNQSEMNVVLNVVNNGEDALQYLRHQSPYEKAKVPDLILLDLNLPRMNGGEVLKEIKSDFRLESIPVIILTTTDNEVDILKMYDLGANSFVTKPDNFEHFKKVMSCIEEFWFVVSKLPKKTGD